MLQTGRNHEGILQAIGGQRGMKYTRVWVATMLGQYQLLRTAGISRSARHGASEYADENGNALAAASSTVARSTIGRRPNRRFAYSNPNRDLRKTFILTRNTPRKYPLHAVPTMYVSGSKIVGCWTSRLGNTPHDKAVVPLMPLDCVTPFTST